MVDTMLRKPITAPPGPRAQKRLAAEEAARQFTKRLNQLHYQADSTWKSPSSIDAARKQAREV